MLNRNSIQNELLIYDKLNLSINVKRILLHLILSFAIFISPISVAPIPFILVFLIYSYIKNNPVNVLLAGIYAILSPSEAVFYPYILVLFVLVLADKSIKKNNTNTYGIKKRMYLLIVYLLIIYFVQLFIEQSILSYPFFALTFLSPMLICFYIWKSKIDDRLTIKLLNEIIFIAIAQLIIAVVFQILPHGIMDFLSNRQHGDYIKGTAFRSSYFANFLLFTVTPFTIQLFLTWKNNKKKMLLIFLSISFIGLAVFNDSKTSVASFLFGVITLLYYQILISTKNALKKYLLISFSILFLFVFNGLLITKVNDITYRYSDYIDGRYNNKLLYYQYTLSPKTRSLFQYFAGTGAGTNGSRAANAIAYEGMYKREGTSVQLPSFIPSKTNKFTKEYLSPLYDYEYAESTGIRSAILGNPFNSFCALYVEFGIIGLLIFCSIFYKLLKSIKHRNDPISKSLVLMIFFLLSQSLVYPIIENGGVMFLFYLFLGLTFKSNLSTSKFLFNEK